jgi:hypothetical protein
MTAHIVDLSVFGHTVGVFPSLVGNPIKMLFQTLNDGKS